MNHNFVSLSLAVALLATLGCSKETVNPETIPVSGVVTLNGDPIEGAQIAFLSTDGKSRGGFATSKDDGSFSASTFQANDGVLPGKYSVTVVKYPAMDSDVGVDMDSEEYTGEEVAEAEEIKNLLPAKYAEKSTTEFAFEFELGQSQTDLKLDLVE